MWKKVIGIVVLVSGLQSCYSPKIPLTPQEKEWGDALAEEYRCEVSMQHDYDAVTNKKSDGVFWIQLANTRYDLCSKDSVFLRKISSKIAGGLIGRLSHRENYDGVAVHFYAEKQTDKRSSHTLCSKGMEVDIDNVDSVEVVEWWRHEERRWPPSDHIIER